MTFPMSRYLITAVLATASMNALATGYQIYQGVSSAGNAFSGEAAVTEDANVVFNNPAAMVFLDGLTVSLPEIEALVSIDARVQDSSLNPGAIPVAGNNRENGGSWNFIPAGMVSYSFLNHRLAIGLGVTSPWGLVTDYTNAFQGRYVATHSRITTINIGPTIAWQPFRCFSIGAGFDAQYFGTDVRQHIFTGTPVDGDLISELDDWAYGWNVGLFYRIEQTHTNLGVTYRSRMKFEPDGHVDFSVPGGPSARGHGKSHVTNPDFATFSFQQDFRYGLSLLGTVSWTHWDLLKKIHETITDIPNIPGGDSVFEFGDTWRVGLAANYQPDECWKLRMGVAYDQSPTGSHERNIRLPDSSHVMLGFGVNYRINRIFDVDAAYDHYFINAGSLAQAVPVAPTLINNFSADIRSNINVFGLQLNMNFPCA